MSLFLWTAAGLAGVTFVIHVFAGGKVAARPLLADASLPPESKWLNYYCWHITSVMIAFVCAAFIWLGASHPQPPMVILLSSLTASLALLSVGVALKGGVHPLRLPSTTLFAAISALGWAALFT
ncbi:MAG: hypothetical protein JKX88_11710 [Marinicaulis sp.]|nr:hypothetical protein [Marinicaulis sp.]